MPSAHSHHHHSASRGSQSSRRQPPLEAEPVSSVQRTTTTRRRTGEENGKPYVEIIETTEEITTRPVPTPRSSRNRRSAPSATEPQSNYPRLAYKDNDRHLKRDQQGRAAPSATNSMITPADSAGGYVSLTNRDERSQPASANRRNTPRAGAAPAAHPHRNAPAVPLGLVESPADMNAMDDYESPKRNRDGGRKYTYGQPTSQTRAARNEANGRGRARRHVAPPPPPLKVESSEEEEDDQTGPYHFRVRIHQCQGVFKDLVEAGKVAPSAYVAVHTAEERGHSGVVKGSFNPVFNDEFLFTSSDPERDALVCTLVASAPDGGRDKKVAECVLALHNVAWQVEREVWVPLVRHPGSTKAYEHGEILVSIYSEDFGYESVPTEAEEAACSSRIHDMLMTYAPEELHRLDWMVADYAPKGPEALAQLKQSYHARTVKPVPVRVTVKSIAGLMDDDGRPTRAETIYVNLTDGVREQRSKVVPYHRRAAVNQEFRLSLKNPDVDNLSLSVYGAGRKLGEVVIGLTNVQAGKPKEVSLMLVRAAETGDATNGGTINIMLQTEGYSSPFQMSSTQESRLRERVTAFLWSYLRDDLHRLDAIVAGVDKEDKYMQEWAATIGPEPQPRELLVNVRGCRNMYGINSNRGGLQPRCYVRIALGPSVVSTGIASVRNGVVAFTNPVTMKVYNPKTDSIDLQLIEETENGEKELSRVTLGVSSLPRQRSVIRTVNLVANAMTRSAQVQGELTVELVAQNFGLAGSAGDAASAKELTPASAAYQRLEAITQRGSPEMLHRVPFLLDSAPPGQEDTVVNEQAKQHGSEVAAAPMSLKIIGMKDFKPACDFYVKAYLNGAAILRTNDVDGAVETKLDMDDNNEANVRLQNAQSASLTFKVAQHRPMRKTKVIGVAEVALANLVRGEKNVLWVPVYASSKGPGSSGANCAAGDKKADKTVKKTAVPSGAPLGTIGLELRSMAFPSNTVVVYKVEGTGEKGGVDANQAVTRDVTSLLSRYSPADLSKVQPLIAQCASLKDAHAELRAKYCRKPVAATVYVNIESVQMCSAAGQTQEANGGVMVEVQCQGERQVSRKVTEFANDAIHQRSRYGQVRLDLPDPESASASRGTTGANALELRLVGCNPSAASRQQRGKSQAYNGQPSARGNANNVSAYNNNGNSAVNGAAHGNSGAGNNEYADPNISGAGGSGDYYVYDQEHDAQSVQSYYVGGENNINSYVKSPKKRRRWSIKQPEDHYTGRPSKMMLMQQEQQQDMSMARSPRGSTTSPGRGAATPRNSRSQRQQGDATQLYDDYNAAYQGQSGSYQYDGENGEDGKYYPGGVNNIRSYMEGGNSPNKSASRRQSASRGRDTSAASPNARRPNSRSEEGGMNAVSVGAVSMSGPSSPVQGELGVVRLSLRALLTAPLYRLGDTVRVPLIAPSRKRPSTTEENRRCVVGHVILRLTTPAFEQIPDSLRLGNRHTTDKIVPAYVHYYERRIGSYLRAYSACDLAEFHYVMYERDVATGSWPVSLYDWMEALLKRHGPETEAFGAEPALPFDPEEWEQNRQKDEAARRQREAAFAASEQGKDEIEVVSAAGTAPSMRQSSAAQKGVKGSAAPASGASSMRGRSSQTARKAEPEAVYTF